MGAINQAAGAGGVEWTTTAGQQSQGDHAGVLVWFSHGKSWVMGLVAGGQSPFITVGPPNHAVHALPAIRARLTSSTPPTSPHRTSHQHLERPGIQRLPIGRAALATVDTQGDLVKLA